VIVSLRQLSGSNCRLDHLDCRYRFEHRATSERSSVVRPYFGNGTFLPPLIAQVEFAPQDVSRVGALIVAISQAAYFLRTGYLRLRSRDVGRYRSNFRSHPMRFALAAIKHGLAVCAFLMANDIP
jgi:hypothetical protein